MLGLLNARISKNLIKFISNFKSFYNYFSVAGRPSRADNKLKYRSYCHLSIPPATENGKEEITSFKEGDIVNLSEILFTKNRNYLIKCNNGQRVKAEQLLGKVVVLYFGSVINITVMFYRSLMRIYKELQPKSSFEVVFVDFHDSYGSELYYENKISDMPWTTIPLSDITCRKQLTQRFGIRKMMPIVSVEYPVIIDPSGMICQCFATFTLLDYGALGYPFSDQRLDFLKSEDAAVAKQPSLRKLLSSSKRDYLLSNNGAQVPIHTLEDKVVALYFYEEGFSDDKFTEELKATYKELAKNNKKFEIVLIYCFEGIRTLGYKSDYTFWKTFNMMPWLALPNDDSNHRMLKRIFRFPYDHDGQEFALIIIGPHMEFIEPFGVFILQNFKISAYPFSRAGVAKLITKEAKELRLEMLWDPNNVFGGKFGSEVLFSQLACKRVLIFFDTGCLLDREAKFLETLKERYIHVMGTDDEFEVIHITGLCSKTKHVANLPWFVLPLGQNYEACLSILFDLLYLRYCGCTSLVAFDRDGRVVRKTCFPTFEDVDFPFYAGDLEKEALSQLVNGFGWDLSSFTETIYTYKQEQEESM